MKSVNQERLPKVKMGEILKETPAFYSRLQ